MDKKCDFCSKMSFFCTLNLDNFSKVVPATYGEFDQKNQKTWLKKWEKMKIHNTFFKMKLICTMVNLMFFVIDTRKNGLYYGENRSSRFVNRLYYGEIFKKVFFVPFLKTQKNRKRVPRSLNPLTNLLTTPYLIAFSSKRKNRMQEKPFP